MCTEIRENTKCFHCGILSCDKDYCKTKSLWWGRVNLYANIYGKDPSNAWAWYRYSYSASVFNEVVSDPSYLPDTNISHFQRYVIN